MRYDPDKHHRRSTRLKGYDYTQEGAYVVTICTFQRECTLGEIDDDGVMTVNVWGEIVQEEWFNTAIVRPYVDLDAFVVMPNHIHGIIVITESQSGEVIRDNAGVWRRQTPTTPPQPAYGKPIKGALGTIVGAFKAVVTKRINALRDTPQAMFWQRSFYDNIILNDRMLNQFRFYIENNPAQWATDRHHPKNES